MVVIPFAGVSPAAAQDRIGVRAGASVDPDQFYFGLHFETRPLADRLRFRPNIEVGLGNDVTLIAGNFEFAYYLPTTTAPWSIYVGGGPAINIFRFDGRSDDTEVEGGFNILFGLAHSGGFFGEFKVGAMDSPDLKFGVGFTF
jgi:hypothetical protein